MRKYVFGLCLVLSSFGVIANEYKMVGEKNEQTSSDNCYKPNIIGCGPCFKRCMSQNQSEQRKDVASSPSKAKKSSGKQSTTAQ
jgi:hypothetical protein